MENLNEAHRGGGFCLSKAGLARNATTATAIDIAAPNGAGVDYCIGGALYHKADAAAIALSAHAAQPADTTCLYLVCLDSNRNLSSVKGGDVKNVDLANKAAVIHFPGVPADKCAIGVIKVKTVAVTFTARTTALNASGVTATFTDLFAVPTAPLAS